MEDFNRQSAQPDEGLYDTGDSLRRDASCNTQIHTLSSLLLDHHLPSLMSPSRLLTLLALAASCRGQVKIYYAPGETPTSAASAATASFTGSTAYNPATLNPPPVPDPLPPMSFDVPMKNGETEGLSIKLGGNFMGFSIEMSVANQVCGSRFFFLGNHQLTSMVSGQKLVCDCLFFHPSLIFG